MPHAEVRTDHAPRPLVVPGEWTAYLPRLQHVADARPDATAITGPSGTWTYRGLMTRIDQVATWLRDRLPQDDAPVGVMVAHDVDVAIVPLALTRLGRVWVNLDPFAPSARIADIAALAGMTACVVDEAHLAQVEGVPALVLDVPADAPVADLPMPQPAADDPLFVVFTSGSTGTPKGVVQQHEQHLNDVYSSIVTWGAGADDAIALLYPMAFVVGPMYMSTALLTGATLHVHDARTSTPRATIDVLVRDRITALPCSPHLLRAITAELDPDETLDDLRVAATAGEGIAGRDVDAFRRHAPRATFVNAFGSSEATSTTAFPVPPGSPLAPGALPAGSPVPNKEVRIVDEAGQPLPAGEVGQLMVVSRYLSGGYWRNDEENAKKFGVLPDGRGTYLQGDLARVDEQGVLSLQGRSDTAIKVRGYLVDLSEVEDALRANETIAESVVIPVVADGEPTRLIAYVAQRPAVRPDSVAELRKHLRRTLPEYMVPSSIVLLPALPRNERGKIDRQNLPAPEAEEVDDTAFAQHELVVAGIWANVLGLDKVPLDGDFLALGGDSLSVEEMLADIGERYGLELSSTDLLAAPTLREFAARVKQGADARTVHPDFVHLRAGGDRRVFCFAGGGALALQFLPLSRRLQGWGVTAFQAHGLEHRAKPDWSVGAHAQRALQVIRQEQPHGPYRLLGHSFGGLVALEVAQRLRADGEDVAVVGMIDTFLPDSATDELAVTEQFGRIEERRPTGLLARVARAVLPVPEASLQDTSPLRAFVRLARARTAGLVRYRGQQQFDTFFYQSVLAAKGYRTAPYPGRAVVVTGPGNGTPEEAWRAVLPGDLRIERVAGEHSAMMREPHVAELAAIVLQELEEAARPHAAV